MSAEIVDKRNMELVPASILKQGDHIIDQSKNVLVVTRTGNGIDYTYCASIATGETFTLSSDKLVQQVHLVISVHLV